MIEGCIVAKLVLGYLKDEGLYKTCAAFQDECPLFCDDNKELDNVFLTADLKTILDDYSQLRESGEGIFSVYCRNKSIHETAKKRKATLAQGHLQEVTSVLNAQGRENGMISGPAVIKSLWNDLDVVIGQLKYATIASSTPDIYTVSQSVRTRRLNNGRSRRTLLPKSQEQRTTTTSPSSLSTAKPTGNTARLNLPLPRLSTNRSQQNLSLPSNKNSTLGNQSRSCSTVVQSNQSNVSKEQPLTLPRASTPVGSPVTILSQSFEGDVQEARAVIDVTPTQSPITIMDRDELAKSDSVVQDMFDDVAAGDTSGGSEYDQWSIKDTAPPVIVVVEEVGKDQIMLNTEGESLAQTHHNLRQDELHLRSPKRKGIQPKKRTPPGSTGTSGAALTSPPREVPESAEVEMDLMCSSDGLTPQSFLGTLLSTPLLQEKLAENINKVVGSSRQQSVGDETLVDLTSQSLMTTEASSSDMPTTSNQGGNDIPVKEILDLMQADPAFDVLFSVFGLDALDALPSTAQAPTDTSLDAEMSVGPRQPMDSPCLLSSSAPPAQLSGALGVPPFPDECQSHSGSNVNTNLPPTSIQQSVSSSSSSTSDLHLSATSIVTDALLLLAGSPQKIPSQTQSQFVHSASYRNSEKQLPKTLPEGNIRVQRSTNRRQSRVSSSCDQPSLITSAFPYVRALDFNFERTPEPTKRGTKENSKSEETPRQKMTANKTKRASSNKKQPKKIRRSVEAKKASSSSSTNSAVFYSKAQSVVPTTVSSSVNTCAAQPLNNCRRPRNLTSSSAVRVVPSAPPMLSCSSVMSSVTTPCALSDTVCSSVVRPSLLPDNLIGPSPLHGNQASSSPQPCYPVKPPPCPIPAAATYVTLGSGPGDSPVTCANLITDPFTAPVSVPATVVRHFQAQDSHPSTESGSHASVNTSHPIPSTVNFSTSVSLNVPSTATLGNTAFASSLSRCNVTSQHLSSTLAVQASAVNPVLWSTPPSPHLTGSVTNQLSLPTNLSYSNPTKKLATSPSSQALNTLSPSSTTGSEQGVLSEQFTDSSANNRKSMAALGRNVNDSSPSGSVTINAEITTTTTCSVPSPSLNASSWLQTIAVKHANSDETKKTTQLVEETIVDAPNPTPRLTSESTLESQSSRENLASKSIKKSQEGTGKANEKHDGEVRHNGSVKDFTNSVSIAGRCTEAMESKNGSTDSLTPNLVSGGPTKENSLGMVQSGSRCETGGRGSLRQPGKRRRDLLRKEKEKGRGSLSRPSKRSKSRGRNVNFPSDLNVDDFLSKLQYEI